MGIFRRVMGSGTALLLLGGPAAADDGFCAPLTRALAAAPTFRSLRGGQTGSEFDGNLIIWEADQCDIRNKSDELGTPLDSPQAKWSYECLYEMRTPQALPALRDLVTGCLPDARYEAGSEFKNESWGGDYDGGIFTVGVNRISIDFNKKTYQLWMTILPPGVKD